MLASEGDAFIQSNHYAMDSIIPKCSELHHLCDAFTTETERRRNLLNKSLELHGLLEKVNCYETVLFPILFAKTSVNLLS